MTSIAIGDSTTTITAKTVVRLHADTAETFVWAGLRDRTMYVRSVEITWVRTDSDPWSWTAWVTGVRPLASGKPGKRFESVYYSGGLRAKAPDWVMSLVATSVPAGAPDPGSGR